MKASDTTNVFNVYVESLVCAVHEGRSFHDFCLHPLLSDKLCSGDTGKYGDSATGTGGHADKKDPYYIDTSRMKKPRNA